MIARSVSRPLPREAPGDIRKGIIYPVFDCSLIKGSALVSGPGTVRKGDRRTGPGKKSEDPNPGYGSYQFVTRMYPVRVFVSDPFAFFTVRETV